MTTTTPAPGALARTAGTVALAAAAAPMFTFTDEQKALLRNTYAKGATEDEFALYLQLASTYGLDPFAREIWCIKLKASDPALIMTSRDGYLRIAQRDPNFVGLHAAAVREGDHFEFEPATGNVVHKFGAKRGSLIGAWAIAKHKLREPVARFVSITEYNKGSGAWATYASAMIEKVAETIVLKRQFGINGLVTQEEVGTLEAIDVEVIRDDLVREADRVVDRSTGEVLEDGGAKQATDLPPAPPDRQAQVKAELKLASLTKEDFQAIIAERFSSKPLSALTPKEFVDLLDVIRASRK